LAEAAVVFPDLIDLSGIGAVLEQIRDEIHHPQFWVNLAEIIWINVLLSGDNALVVAMACRGLEPRQRLWGMVLGTAAAVLLRIAFTVIVTSVMGLPYLKLAGGLALLVIAMKLLVPTVEDDKIGAASHLWAAVQIVVVADIVMSLDNVVAVAAAADGSIPLLIFGLASSVPLVIAGAALIMGLLSMMPILIWAGSGLLGWIAGDVIASDPAVHPRLQTFFEGGIGFEFDALLTLLGVAPLFVGLNGGAFACAVLGVIVVLVLGSIWRRLSLQRAAARQAH
jgi:YjbE family integral membrane protein